jgi:hypothetical protein
LTAHGGQLAPTSSILLLREQKGLLVPQLLVVAVAGYATSLVEMFAVIRDFGPVQFSVRGY